MKREDFISIIKLRSTWKVNKGDYKLPNGKILKVYIRSLVESQMNLDKLGIREDGNLCFCHGGEYNPETEAFNDYVLLPAFVEKEVCSFDEMEKRVNRLISDIVG